MKWWNWQARWEAKERERTIQLKTINNEMYDRGQSQFKVRHIDKLNCLWNHQNISKFRFLQGTPHHCTTFILSPISLPYASTIQPKNNKHQQYGLEVSPGPDIFLCVCLLDESLDELRSYENNQKRKLGELFAYLVISTFSAGGSIGDPAVSTDRQMIMIPSRKMKNGNMVKDKKRTWTSSKGIVKYTCRYSCSVSLIIMVDPGDDWWWRCE